MRRGVSVQDRFRTFGWPRGLILDGLTEAQGWSVVGESIALYSLAAVLIPVFFGSTDTKFWSVIPSVPRPIPAIQDKADLQDVQQVSEEKVRKLIKRRRIGGV